MAFEKIVVKGNDILIKTLLFIKINLSFEDIKKLKEREWVSNVNKSYSYGIYTDKKIYTISDSMMGFHTFMQIVRDKGIYIETIAEQIKLRKKKKKEK